MNNRKYYIDNLRSFAILLVFVAHIIIIYSQDHTFYIQGEQFLPAIFMRIIATFLMPLLFAVAGMSSRYALERRSAGEYTKERVSKLLLPLIFGTLLIIPVQPYIAALHSNGEANYFDSFTKITDLTGYDGAFTPANLWFLLYLFVVSMICLPFMMWYKNKGKGTLGDKVPLIPVILMGLIPCITQNEALKIIAIDGKSILEYSAYFLLGYFFLSNDNLLKKLDKYRFLLLGMTVLYTWFMEVILDGEFREAAYWLAILVILGMGRHYLNFGGKITAYLSKSSFGVYIFHQSWIVIAAFFVFKVTDSPVLQIPLISLSSVILTYLTYEIFRRISVFRWMFGLKK